MNRKLESLDDLAEEAARLQGEEADRRDADPAREARREAKQRAQDAQIKHEIEQGLRAADGSLLDEDLPDEEEE